jgi:parallel beta-helix repeat protein
MKTVSSCFIFVFLLVFGAFAITPASAQSPVTYYVSSVNPAANDANPGTQAAPWRSLARVQTAIATLRPGDQVLFERGGTFSGSLSTTRLTGTTAAPIVFGAYGSGAAPIISGLETLGGWVSLGGNRWEATCAACGMRVNHLLIDSQSQALARYPNLDQGDEGYLYFDSVVGRTSITDDALIGQNWVGGEIALRTIAWVIDRLPITSQVGGTLTSTTAATYDLEVGYGYFIQNHPAALDRQGEWTYNPTTRKITLFSATNPASLRVQVTTVDRLLDFDNITDVQMRDLILQGGNEFTFDGDNCTRLKIERVEMLYSGAEAVRLNNCVALEITSSRLAYALNFGLRLWACRDCQVHGNTIEQIAMLAGMGKGSNGQYNGVQFNGTNSVFENNIVRYTGYLGVNFGGTVTIRNNHISYFNRVKVDGGGIYGWHAVGARIIGNIVLYGDGSSAGIPWDGTATHGIYIDDNSENIEVRDNTVGYMSESGIYLHNTRNVQVVNNTIFAVGHQGMLLADDELGSYNIEQSLIENNQVFAVAPNAVGMRLITNKVESNFLGWVGTIRNNTYCLPTRDASIRMTNASGSWVSVDYSLAQWQARSGKEAGSTNCAIRLSSYIERGVLGGNQIANSTLASNANGWVRWPEATTNMAWDARMGGSLRFANTGSTGALGYHVIGAVTQNTFYRVRVRGVSDGGGTSVGLVISRQGDDYGFISQPTQIILTGTERDFVAYIRVRNNYPNGRLNFILEPGTQPIWVDNIEVTAVDVVPLTADAAARFEYNATTTVRSFTLDQAYTDPRGTAYAAGSTVTLQPYTSIILIRSAPTTSVTLDGTVTLQGRSAANLPLRVRVGSTDYVPTTNASGVFALASLTPGSYTIRIKHAQSLAITQSATLNAGANALTFPALRLGDVNDDNAISLADFSILASTFNRTVGQSGYDVRADLNGDGAVTLADFSLLANNFNQTGAP